MFHFLTCRSDDRPTEHREGPSDITERIHQTGGEETRAGQRVSKHMFNMSACLGALRLSFASQITKQQVNILLLFLHQMGRQTGLTDKHSHAGP